MGHLNPHRASAGEVFVQHSGKIVVGVLLGGAGGGVVGYLLGNGQMLWIATGAGAGAVGGFTVAYIGARALEDVRADVLLYTDALALGKIRPHHAVGRLDFSEQVEKQELLHAAEAAALAAVEAIEKRAAKAEAKAPPPPAIHQAAR